MENESVKTRSISNDILKTSAIMALTTITSIFMCKVPVLSSNLVFIYILSIMAVSITTSGYFYSLISAWFYISFNNIFIEDSFSSVNFFLQLTVMLIISVLTSSTSVRFKESSLNFKELSEKSKKLNEINNKLISLGCLEQIIDIALDYIVEITHHTIIFYAHDPQSVENGITKNCNPEQEKILTSFHEKFIAHWVFENKKAAGFGTDFNGQSCSIYFPLISHDNIWGVLGLYCIDQQFFEEKDISILNLIISQMALAMERQYLADSRQLMIIETEKEKMRSNLLRAVSHDLRTPLTGMIGASATLLENIGKLSEEDQKKLTMHIHEDSNWLLHMVENLLSVTRITGEDARVHKTSEPIEEVVSEAVVRLKKRYPDARISVKVPDEFLMVPMDATLIEQVILNIAENAIKYSKSTKPIELSVTKENDFVLFHILDYGTGLSEDSLKNLFDGYSLNPNKSSDSSKGMGIGLSICKTIIDAHGGTIEGKNHAAGGAVFIFSLPIEEGNKCLVKYPY